MLISRRVISPRKAYLILFGLTFLILLVVGYIRWDIEQINRRSSQNQIVTTKNKPVDATQRSEKDQLIDIFRRLKRYGNWPLLEPISLSANRGNPFAPKTD